MQRTPDAIK